MAKKHASSKKTISKGIFPRIQKIVDFNLNGLNEILPKKSNLKLFVTQESESIYRAVIKVRLWKKEILIKEEASDPSEAFFNAKKRARRCIESHRSKKKLSPRRKHSPRSENHIYDDSEVLTYYDYKNDKDFQQAS